tara:strand:+ start:3747 stop:4163 length:417 start_codon:yes stop_codon:yes gene_type:complete
MATVALTRQDDNTLKACFDSDLDYIKRLPKGDIFFYTVVKERNIGNHRRFFALIKMVFENQDHYNNIDQLRADLLKSAGHYTKRFTFWGEEVTDPKSISFASMDEVAFEDLFRDVTTEIVKHFNFDSETIVENVNRYF